ncbi:MAG: ATP-binding protein [Pseudomonadota bacterium]|nr:hypothetical protein [Pseudomonadales bacterium]MDY6920816.1 ATP-binding protein [Pseudomonadota bacterium]
MDYQAAYLAERERRLQAEKLLDEKTREVASSLNMIQYQYRSLANQKKGLELLLNVAQIGELRLDWETVLYVFIEAVGQLFEVDYGLVFMREPGAAAAEPMSSSTISYLPLDNYPDSTLNLLRGDRQFDLSSTVGRKVLEGSQVIQINQDTAGTPQAPAWRLYFPIRKKGEIIAVAEFGISGWKEENATYLTLAMAASASIGVMLERADAHSKLQENFAALKQAHEQLKSAQSQLVQSEKMASIGQLAAGVAHEINNPVGFVISNIDTLQDYLAGILEVCAGYEQYLAVNTTEAPEASAVRQQIAAIKRKHDLAFILDDIEQVVRDSSEGLNRVKDIVLSLKNFARADQGELQPVSVDEIINDALKMIHNELKYHVQLETDLQAPSALLCNAAQLSQVVVNLVINASQAIAERGTIRVETRETESRTQIRIADTGCGIPAEQLSRIFDPFFTTKPVDVGTGLGLSISHGIIEQHGGSISVSSEVGQGTVFSISLPRG